MKLILFEDTDDQAELLMKALKARMTTSGVVYRFEPQNGDDARIFEDRLIAQLSTDDYKDATLIVADRDLSKTGSYRGLSEPTVRRAAEELATPECSYARNAVERAFLTAAEAREAYITVSIAKGPESFAEKIVSIADGFAAIASALPSAVGGPGKKTLGKILATLLEKPEYAEKIALYASGDQNRLASVLQMKDRDPKEKLRTATCLLGYWLWDSVLRFPGVVVNMVAASSYLNIRFEDFRDRPELRSIFDEARYAGPFAQAKGQLWWRGMLDDIVARKECKDGRECASKILDQDVARSECCEDSNEPAGYYCMLSDKPVSLKNSRGGLPWFPRGADLARVSASQYDELGPWL